MADLVDQLQTGYCRTASCARPILWATTPAGKRMPLDPTPTFDGTVTLDTDLFGQPVATVHGQPPYHLPDRYLPHWASCPAADSWRTPR